VNHFVLLIVCFVSIGIFVRLRFIHHLTSLSKVSIKSFKVLVNKRISDHWKEIAIQAYASLMMKSSLNILSILFCIVCIFLIADFFFKDFIVFATSLIGILELLLFAFVYVKSKKLLAK